MNFKHSIFLWSMFMLLGCLRTNAQNLNDALRYSQYDYFGTARSAAVAGSLGALGADFSVISTNPAGLGWMRKSQFLITPMFNLYNGKTTLTNGNNSQVSESAASFSLAGLGMVFAGRSRNPRWQTVNFALGYNRLADFNRETVYRGISKGSIMNRFTELANSEFGPNGFPFEAGVANDAEAFLIDELTGIYYSDFDDAPDADVEREQIIDAGGGVNELSFAVSGNYNDQLLIGLGVGLPFINYTENKTYFEGDINNQVPAFEDLQYEENLTTTGFGVNVRLGLIYRLNQMVRLGAAVHTPTWFSLEDNFITSMFYSYSINGVGDNGSGQVIGEPFRYKLRTPWRFSGGAGFIFGRSGFISGELEWVNYANNHLGITGFPEDEEIANREISTQLKSSINFKIGGELALQKFRLRAGVSLRQQPYSDTSDLPAFNMQYNAGFGYSWESFFLDLAGRYSTSEETYRPYLTASYPEQVFENKSNYIRVLLTAGFRF